MTEVRGVVERNALKSRDLALCEPLVHHNGPLAALNDHPVLLLHQIQHGRRHRHDPGANRGFGNRGELARV